MPRGAVIQRSPELANRAATLERAVASLHEAAQEGAQLVVFPEAFVPGYPVWMWRLRPGGDLALTEPLHALLRAGSVSLAPAELPPLPAAPKERAGTLVFGLDGRDADFSRRTLDKAGAGIGPAGA